MIHPRRGLGLTALLILLAVTPAHAHGFHGFGILLIALFAAAPGALILFICLLVTLWMRRRPKASRGRRIYSQLVRAFAYLMPAVIIFGGLSLERWRLVDDLGWVLLGLVALFCALALPTAHLSRDLGQGESELDDVGEHPAQP